MKRSRRRRIVGSRMDGAIDELIPVELRHLSRTHWTPVDVAVRVVTLLAPSKHMRILDVGAGVGKLCAIGALSAFGTWYGVEQHAPLVEAARRLARTLGVDQRTSFVHGDAFALDWSKYDALYLYNPFEVPLHPADAGDCEARFRIQVAQMERRLAALPKGARVVTLHGFGGVMPSSFELVYQEHVPQVAHDLVLWVQRQSVESVAS